MKKLLVLSIVVAVLLVAPIVSTAQDASGACNGLAKALENIPVDSPGYAKVLEKAQQNECSYAVEHAALVDFHNEAGGILVWNSGTLVPLWPDLDSDHCSWEGVTCNADGHVYLLQLRGIKTSGTLSGTLGNLRYMHTIDLAASGITGPGLSGPIPDALMGMGSLNPPFGEPFTIDFEHTELGCWESLAGHDWAHQLTYYSSPPSDRECGQAWDHAALLALYNATDGANWTDSTNWLTTANHCGDDDLGGWYGVYCDASGRVSDLWLNNNNLNGNMPPALGSMSNLYRLYLNHNANLVGSIPAELGSLSNLAYLALQNTGLTGIIPAQLSNLSSAVGINLSYTGLGCWETEAAYLWAHNLTEYYAPLTDCFIP